MKELSSEYNPLEVEKRVREWWNQNRVQSKVYDLRKGKKLFRFLEGPPTANGFMHIGHARGRAMKDVVLRYQTMKGYDVWRMAGWDCQGLPVELEVEKKLGLHSKLDIERIGLEKFVSECSRLVDEYIAHWRSDSERLGLWLDYESAYQTRSDDYIETVWWVIKKAFERGLLKEDFKVVPTCPRCETSLSSHEVAQGYALVVDPSIYVKFGLVSRKNEFILIWTTTPWTLPGDEAVTIHPDYDYARVKVGSDIWILANELVSRVMNELKIQNFHVLSIVKGRELEGLKYVHPLLEETPEHGKHDAKYAHSIVLGEHVTVEDGTGCVHTAPAHGPEDFEVGQKYGLETFSPVGQNGIFKAETGKYAGKFAKTTDPEIINDLRSKNLLVKSGEIEHDYPLCWRCDSPLIYIADRQWFIKTEPIRARMIAENKEVDWVPDWAGKNRFGEWLVNSGDWCISRSRIWGSPLNVWKCEKCGHFDVLGTRSELKHRAKKMPTHFELHRPWIDEVELSCNKCNASMKRVPFVLDTWLDSGMAHSASVGYLSDDTLFSRLYPYDFITEAIDQTRGWFYSLLATSVVLFEKKPYNRVLCQGHILDKFGQKMSKSKGNVVWANGAIEQQGADPLRLYVLSKAAPEDTLAYDEDEIDQVKRKLTIFWNVYGFTRSYMALDRFTPEEWQSAETILPSLRFEDKWLLSKTQALVHEVTRQMEELRLHKAARLILDFVLDEISRFYIKVIRRRTWIEASDIEKTAAYWTLHRSLTICARLLAPFAPHVAESLFQAITNSETSVQSADWPTPEDRLRDVGLEEEMTICREILRA
ncbi:MAG: isoleucine--tRNA ligase, partial [Candidatus Bathyarchaeia archaeon]